MDHQGGGSLNRLAFSATLHCLTGCAIGEVLGMVVGTALGWASVLARTKARRISTPTGITDLTTDILVSDVVTCGSAAPRPLRPA